MNMNGAWMLLREHREHLRRVRFEHDVARGVVPAGIAGSVPNFFALDLGIGHARRRQVEDHVGEVDVEGVRGDLVVIRLILIVTRPVKLCSCETS